VPNAEEEARGPPKGQTGGGGPQAAPVPGARRRGGRKPGRRSPCLPLPPPRRAAARGPARVETAPPAHPPQRRSGEAGSARRAEGNPPPAQGYVRDVPTPQDPDAIGDGDPARLGVRGGADGRAAPPRGAAVRRSQRRLPVGERICENAAEGYMHLRRIVYLCVVAAGCSGGGDAPHARSS